MLTEWLQRLRRAIPCLSTVKRHWHPVEIERLEERKGFTTTVTLKSSRSKRGRRGALTSPCKRLPQNLKHGIQLPTENRILFYNSTSLNNPMSLDTEYSETLRSIWRRKKIRKASITTGLISSTIERGRKELPTQPSTSSLQSFNRGVYYKQLQTGSNWVWSCKQHPT